MGKMFKEYSDMLVSGEYENEEDLCNGEGLNYDELYEDEDEDEDS